MKPSGNGGANTLRRPADLSGLGLLLFVFALGVYFVGRYGGYWAETDSATFTRLIQVFVQEGRLVPQQAEVYPNGYAFQAISAYLVALTGLDVPTLQRLVAPLLAALVALPALMLYRLFTGSRRGAVIASLLLFTQPEFLFVILRSSHEKFSRTLMLVCLFLLARSLTGRYARGQLLTLLAPFFLAMFALIATNNLLGHSFIFALALVLLFGWLGQTRLTDEARRDLGSFYLRLLLSIVLIAVVLDYLFIFVIYPPATHDLAVLKSIGDQIALLLFGPTAQTSEVYATYGQVSASWVNLGIYFLLSLANWIVLLASLVIWLRQGVAWLWRRQAAPGPVAWLLWLFYAAFAVQGGLAVLADLSGALSSNLQHRLFPSLAMVGVALVGQAVVDWRPQRHASAARRGLALGLAVLATLSIIKATNEPLLSNKWTFYRDTEWLAIEWTDTYLSEARVWTEFDERLAITFPMLKGGWSERNTFGWNTVTPTTRYLLLTDVTRLRSYRLERPVPLPPDAQPIYDNGAAQLYYFRPQTPYQR